jgi:hypothetical protein
MSGTVSARLEQPEGPRDMVRAARDKLDELLPGH